MIKVEIPIRVILEGKKYESGVHTLPKKEAMGLLIRGFAKAIKQRDVERTSI
jgi:hypothetical protein